MRIISKFHDYYDSVQRQGMDKDCLYLRENKEITIPAQYNIYNRHHSDYSLNTFILGFCGQIYTIYKVQGRREGSTVNEIFFNLQDVKEFTMPLKLTSESDFNSRWWKSGLQKFSEVNLKALTELFHTHQVPIFLIKYNTQTKFETLELNPCLVNLRFQKIKPPFEAYQEIFQFVSGVLNSRENSMVQISDKDKIDKHGFDKWSFRQKGPKK